MQPLHRFYRQLEQVMEGFQIDPTEVLKRVEGQFAAWDPLSFLHFDTLKAHFEAHFEKSIQSLGILPCSSFVPDLIPVFQKHFPSIQLCDSYKTGEIAGILVQTPQDAAQNPPDAWYMGSRDPKVQDALFNVIPRKSVLRAEDFFPLPDLLDIALDQGQIREVDHILEKLENAADPILVFDAQYFNNYCPTYQALENQGYQVFLFSSIAQILYAAPDSQFDDLPFQNKFRLNIRQRVYLLEKLQHGILLMNHVSYLIPGFDAEKAIASMAYIRTWMRLAKVPVVLYLYDMISPISKNLQWESDYLKMYQCMVQEADGLILNSNLQNGLDALRNTFNLKQPMISYLRYNGSVKELAETRQDGFHIALIGGMDDDLRDMGAMLKQALNQGFHLHNFVYNHWTEAFIQSLNSEQKLYYHQHSSIQDQDELIYEVSHYHAGWILDNTYKWIDLLANLKNPVLRDLMIAFRTSTVTSSQLLLGAAGIPCILNRTMVDIQNFFDACYFFPLESSELHALPQLIKNENWSTRLEACRKNRHQFSAKNRITQLTQFLEKHFVRNHADA